MDGDLLALLDRGYLDVIDDLLTAIVGGMVNEPLRYDGSDSYPLAEPAADVRGVASILREPDPADPGGLGTPTYYAFVKAIDFTFDAGANAVVWQDQGRRPDHGTTFFVDYLRRERRSPLTDINVGSVTRTLTEAIGREIATLHAQVKRAYLSAFVDTAEGRSLDLVVAILGIARMTGEFAQGLVSFLRDPAALGGSITIPAGTLLTTKTSEPVFVTAEDRTLQSAQVRVDVPVRATTGFPGDAGIVAAGAIMSLAHPIAGVAQVTNLDATVLGAAPETDAQLRVRARRTLQSLGKATLAAIERAVTEERAHLVEVVESDGRILVRVECEPERLPGVKAAVHETRAAGVVAEVVAPFVTFAPRVRARVAAGLSHAARDRIVGEVIAALQLVVDPLGPGQAVDGHELLDAVRAIPSLQDPAQPARIVSVGAWGVGDAGGAPPPRPDLVQAPAGGQASDAQIESGDFRVVPVDQKSWVALAMTADDVILVER